MKDSLTKDFYTQQAIVRELIIKGDNNSAKFWEEHSKMIKLQLELYGKRLGTSILLEKRDK
jgi:hypothetical protein